ncbi:MAG: F0F1 ATP synthase subunit B, partial [Acidimicrobiales bacterium]
FASATGASSGNGGNFLIPNGTFVVELVIFLVVLGIIAKWILPPLQEVAETRRTRVLTALQQGEEARAAALSVLAERDSVLSEARVQARAIIDQANQGADTALEQGRAQGQEEYERLVGASRQEISAEGTRARQELVSQLDSLVVSAAERVLGNGVDPARHRELIHEAVAAATRGASSGGAS